MLRNAVAKGFQFALCVQAEKSTACLHNTDDGKVLARMLERFARQQRGAEATQQLSTTTPAAYQGACRPNRRTGTGRRHRRSDEGANE
jgi:hypothetical protein